MARETPAAYHVQVVLTGNQSNSDTFTVPAGHEFICTELTHKKTGACQLNSIKAPTENILAEGFPIELIAGEITRRLPLPAPLRIGGSTTVTVEFLDTSGAGNTVDLVFLGVLRTIGPEE